MKASPCELRNVVLLSWRAPTGPWILRRLGPDEPRGIPSTGRGGSRLSSHDQLQPTRPRTGTRSRACQWRGSECVPPVCPGPPHRRSPCISCTELDGGGRPSALWEEPSQREGQGFESP